jgi:hypothetical protein
LNLLRRRCSTITKISKQKKKKKKRKGHRDDPRAKPFCPQRSSQDIAKEYMNAKRGKERRKRIKYRDEHSCRKLSKSRYGRQGGVALSGSG